MNRRAERDWPSSADLKWPWEMYECPWALVMTVVVAAVAAVGGGHWKYADATTARDVEVSAYAFINGYAPRIWMALAKDWVASKKQFDKSVAAKKDVWYISRKFDGVRCIAFIDGGDVTLLSRTGKKFTGPLGVVSSALGELALPNLASESWVLDGELCAVNANGDEIFQETVSYVRRKRKRDAPVPEFRYYVFDLLTRQEFDQGFSTGSRRVLSQRLCTLQQILGKTSKAVQNRIVGVTQEKWSPQNFERVWKHAEEQKWEGLMLRKDTHYKGKRSHDLIKYKTFQTAEFTVEDVTTGKMRIVDEKTGLETTITALKAAQISYKGSPVHVGSGFTIAERQKYFKNPEALIGKIIEVQYFAESQDKHGKYSLRFPTLKCIWGDKRDA